jgi:hypothetical protein
MRFDGRVSREQKKTVRAAKVAGIVVEVMRPDGTVLRFDGDELSQQRLDLFARRAKINGYAALPWVMADNTVSEVTPEEMEEALDLALQKQGQLWFL